MTDTSKPGATSPSPGEVPTERPASLKGLDVLVGEWDTQALFPGDPPVAGGSRTTLGGLRHGTSSFSG